ncbi:hypothetical protein [Nostoc commune]|uniref:hypothetical protein n=1 Tax=Nostoc commune TaxID=1178 RepID=UPI0011B21F9D|nr:hypothetical protein [Nostoc commune]
MLYRIIPKNTALLMWRDRLPAHARRSHIATAQNQVPWNNRFTCENFPTKELISGKRPTKFNKAC